MVLPSKIMVFLGFAWILPLNILLCLRHGYRGSVSYTVMEKKVVEESTEEPSWRRALRGIGTELMRGQY